MSTISTGRKTDFSKKDAPLIFFNKIKKGKITIEEAKESQKDFINYLKMIRKGNKNQAQEKTLKNLNMLFNGGNDAINFIEDYSPMILEAKRKASEELKEQEGTGLKILPPKRMLQRLPIALSRVKAGDHSESLLNYIRQIVYSLHQSREITKKVYNNIIN